MESAIIADTFNAHFLSIPHKTISMLPASDISSLSFISTGSVPPLEFTSVTDEVVMLLGSLDPRKTKGKNGIPAQFLQACPLGMAHLVTVVLNKCLHSSTFPAGIVEGCYCNILQCFLNGCNNTIVTPIQKTLQNTELTNFRSISVLPVLSKLFERIVYDQLMAHLNNFDLLLVCQSGFRPG